MRRSPNPWEKIRIGGIIESKRLIMVSILSMPDVPGIAGEVLSTMGNSDINVEFITEGRNIDGYADITFCVSSDYRDRLKELMKDLRERIKPKGEHWFENVSMIGIYGPHFREKPSIAGKMCKALGKAQINILGISTSISTVSCIIDGDKFDTAKEALLTIFSLP